MLHFQFLMQEEKGHLHVKPLAHPTWGRWLLLTLCEVKEVQQGTAGSQGRHKGKQQGVTELSGTDSRLSAVVFSDSKEPQLPERLRRCFFGPILVSLNAPAEREGGFFGWERWGVNPMLAPRVNPLVKSHQEQIWSWSRATERCSAENQHPWSELAPLVTPLHARGKLSSSWLNPLGSREPQASRGRLGGGKHEHIFTEIGVSLQQKIP